MKRSIAAWRGVDARVVAETCSPVVVANTIQDARADIQALHAAALTAAHDARNALGPVVLLCDEHLEGAHDVGWDEAQVCIQKALAALDALEKATGRTAPPWLIP